MKLFERLMIGAKGAAAPAMVALLGMLTGPTGLIPPAWADATWVGAGSDSNWSTGANWLEGVPPANPQPVTVGGADGLILFNSQPTALESVVDVPWQIGRIAFGPQAGAFRLSGAPVVLLQSYPALSAGLAVVQHEGPLTVTIDNDLLFDSTLLGRPLSVGNDGDLIVNGRLIKSDTEAGELWLCGSGPGLGVINGTIEFGTNAVWKTGASTWVIARAGHQFGSLRLSAGTVRLGTGNALPIYVGVEFEGAGPGLLDLSDHGQQLAFVRSAAVEPDGVFRIETGSGPGGTLCIEDAGGTNELVGVEITGNGRLVKAGPGWLVLAGANTYRGGTWIRAGALQVGSGGTTGNLGEGPVTNDALLVLNRTDAVVLTNVLVGCGTLEKRNTNTLTLTDACEDFEGPIAVLAGTLRANGSNCLGSPVSGVTIADGAQLDLNGSDVGLEPVSVQGAGPDGRGAIINDGPYSYWGLRFVTLTGDTTFGGSNRWDIRNTGTGARLIGQGFSLTKVGPWKVWIVGVGETDVGDVFVREGWLGIEETTTFSDTNKSVFVSSNAVWGNWNLSNAQYRAVFLTNAVWECNSGFNTNFGPVTLLGSNRFTVGATLTLGGVVTGPGGLTKLNGGTLVLAHDNTYGGETVVAAGTLQIGALGDRGSVAGAIVNNATLVFRRGDAFSFSAGISGNGTVVHEADAGPLTLAGTNTARQLVARAGSTTAPLVLGRGSLHQVRDSLIVGQGSNTSSRVLIEPEARLEVRAVSVGNTPGPASGVVEQWGGSVVVSNVFRLGNAADQTSSWELVDGSLVLSGTPTGVVNPATAAEQPGILYVGLDGTGQFIQRGGWAQVHGVVLDGRAETPGTDLFELAGGTLVVGPSGFSSGALNQNRSFEIRLGSGTVRASADWASALPMTLTGTGGNVVIDPAGQTIRLSGSLTGPGGLILAGAGTVVLSNVHSYSGPTCVSNGTLRVEGELSRGADPVTVAGGQLTGGGVIHAPVTVLAEGTLAPGTGLGVLEVRDALTLQGTIILELRKTGSALTNDRVCGVTELTYGGRLVVQATGSPLAHGDAFKLFEAQSYTGTFAALDLPLLPTGLTWDTSGLLLDGTIRVTTLTPPTLQIALRPDAIELTWPAEAMGFVLQAQTNAAGIGTNWVDVLTGVQNSRFILSPIPRHETVFFRLIAR